MGFADSYLQKQKGFSPVFNDPPSEKLRYAVVIPAYCEPAISGVLESLWNCKRPQGHIEVILVVNAPEDATPAVKAANLDTLKNAENWIREHNDPVVRFLLIDRTSMPSRDAGVGLARKTGMDEALSRFSQVGHPHGFILSLDADSHCDDNYFLAIEETITANPSLNGLDIYFEHPVSGTGFPESIYRGITEYELHLRCLNLFLRYSGFLYAYHTIGSCFGVRADAYAAQGGMNKRKAGEDFYFLHKIIPLGHFAEINTTRVVPSPRISDRVPFGTGAAMGKYISSEPEGIMTYAPESYLLLRTFFQQAAQLYKGDPVETANALRQLPGFLSEYLEKLHAVEAIGEINANCSSPSSFINRFYRWFDAFRIVKFLNYASSSVYGKVPVREAALQYLKITCYPLQDESIGNFELLKLFRKFERGV
jgi:glycosyltransferase involved in cell wall biosynthesis